MINQIILKASLDSYIIFINRQSLNFSVLKNIAESVFVSWVCVLWGMFGNKRRKRHEDLKEGRCNYNTWVVF